MIHVDDIDTAVAYLRTVPGVVVQLGPNTCPRARRFAGVRTCYLQTPWGYQMELISAPDRLPYEELTDVRVAPPAMAWT